MDEILNWSRDRWQLLLNIQIIYAIFFYLLLAINGQHVRFFAAGIMLVLLVLNRYQDKNEPTHYAVIWLNLFFLPAGFCEIWAITGNNLLTWFKPISILVILILWAFWLVLFLPVAMVSASQIHNWFLRLFAFLAFLDIQYGWGVGLNISRNLRIMHSINSQGVVSAFALLILVCFLVHSWGYRFNPNLRFLPSRNFSYKVYATLIFLLTINLCWNVFGGQGENIFSVLFQYSVDIQSKYIDWPSFTSALEPGILEEAERYIEIIILLAASQHLREWRVPIAIYGSTLLFALSHLTNIGWHGQSTMGTIAQVVAVTDAMAWAAAYLYIGKLWPIMIVHFLNDYLINIQSGWSSTSGWSGDFNDWATMFIPLIFGLAVTIWMMYGKRRQVMEENVDRLLGDDYSNYALPSFIGR